MNKDSTCAFFAKNRQLFFLIKGKLTVCYSLDRGVFYGSCATNLKNVGLSGLGTSNGAIACGGNKFLGICDRMLSHAMNSATGIEIQMSLMFPMFSVIESASESGLVSTTISPGNVILAKSVTLLRVLGSNLP